MGIDALGIARLPGIFDHAGYEVTVLAPRGTAILSSRFVRQRLTVAGGPHQVAAELARCVDEFVQRFVWILACDEPLLEALSARADLAYLASRMPFLPAPGALSEMLSKISFLSRARAAGIVLPEFTICHTADEAAEAGSRYGYPVVLKQARSMAGSGVRKIENAGEMRDVMAQLNDGECLVQRFVSGRVGATTILMERGIPVRHFSFYKLYTWPHAFSPSGGGELTENPQFALLAAKVGALFQFHGLCSLDWMEEAGTGLIHLIELNPRSTPSACLSAWAGSDFVEALRGMHQRTAAIAPVEPQGLAGRRFRMFPEACFRAIEDGNPILLVQSLCAAPWRDPGLLCAQVRRVITHYMPLRLKTALKRSASLTIRFLGARSGVTP